MKYTKEDLKIGRCFQSGHKYFLIVGKIKDGLIRTVYYSNTFSVREFDNVRDLLDTFNNHNYKISHLPIGLDLNLKLEKIHRP